MVVIHDLEALAEHIADLRFDIHMRNNRYPLVRIESDLPQPNSGRVIEYFLSVKSGLTAVLEELPYKSVDRTDGEIHNSGVRLHEKLSLLVAPYTVDYSEFELIVDKIPYRRIAEDSPSAILMKLANHSYSLPEAIDALKHVMNLYQRRYSDYPAIENLLDELDLVEMLYRLRH